MPFVDRWYKYDILSDYCISGAFAMANDNQLTRCAPDALGIAPADILRFVQAVEETIDEMHSFMLLRHGQVAAEGWWWPYAPEKPHMLYSLSKSFTAAAVGLAAAEGRLSLDDTVLSFFPEDAQPEVSPNLAAMRVRHLLSMSTGHAEDTTGYLHNSPDGNWVKAFLSRPVTYAPGTHFLYNSGASYMLAAIVHHLTGKSLVDYLQPRLFDPLGIEKPYWETCPRGIETGGWGLNLRTEDIARFGQMYLQKGSWQGQQILPEAWVAEASSKHIDNSLGKNSDWEQGYGFQFWRCHHNAYRGDGAFGQYCIVMPEQDAMMAITGGVKDMQAVLSLVWEHLLKKMSPEALAPAPQEHAMLTEKLGGLRYEPPAGDANSPLQGEVSGRLYTLEPNEFGIQAFRLLFNVDQFQLQAVYPDGERVLAGGMGRWLENITTFTESGEEKPIVGSGVWLREDTFEITARFYLTPYVYTFTLHFAGNTLSTVMKVNVSFGPTEFPPIVGKWAES
jgi:CubicO group peptidase (beta-lactamase class C family)